MTLNINLMTLIINFTTLHFTKFNIGISVKYKIINFNLHKKRDKKLFSHLKSIMYREFLV